MGAHSLSSLYFHTGLRKVLLLEPRSKTNKHNCNYGRQESCWREYKEGFRQRKEGRSRCCESRTGERKERSRSSKESRTSTKESRERRPPCRRRERSSRC